MSVPQAEIEYQKSHWNQDRAPPMVIGTIVSLALAAISVLIRLFVHKAVRKHLGWDDFLIVPALVSLDIAFGGRPKSSANVVRTGAYGSDVWYAHSRH